MTTSNRIVYLDVFRFLMVTVALLSHVLGYFNTWDALGEQPRLYLRLFTRGATPGLLILFGFMLEFVYVKHAQHRGLGYSIKRMSYRAALCYLAFILVAAAGIVGGHTSATDFVGNLLLVSSAINANIFAVYFFMLFAVMPVIALRLRFGITSLLAAITGIWLLDAAVLRSIDSPFSGALDNLDYLSGFLMGLGESQGPSIFHGLTAVLFGMVFGNTFATRSRTSALCLVGLTGTALSILGMEISSVGWTGFLANVADYNAYRAHNSIVYYAYGIVHAVLVMLLAWGLNKLLPQVVRTPVTYLGSRTFLYFLFGNLILSAVPHSFVNTSFWLGVGEAVVLAVTCYALILLWEAKVDGWPPVVEVRKRMLGGSERLMNLLRRLSAVH